MISLFRKNLFFNSLLLLPYIAILRLKSFFLDVPFAASAGDSFIVKNIYSLFSSTTSQAILGIFIVFINALLINRMVIKNNLSKDSNNLVSGLMYGLFASLLLDFVPFSPVLISTTFVLLSLQCIFNSYNNMQVSDEIFLSGFYMSIASLIYFPVIYFALLTFIGFIIMKSFTFKERIQHLIGWIVPFYLVNGIQYFFNVVPTDFPAYFYNKLTINFFMNIGLGDLITVLISLIIVAICIFSYSLYMSKKVIASQKRVSILYWLILFTGIVSIFYPGINVNHLHLLLIPFSIFLTINLLEMKNQVIPEIIHLLLVLLLVVMHLDLINF